MRNYRRFTPSSRNRFCSIYEGACVTHEGSLGFDYIYSDEDAGGHVQVCPRRGGKEHGLFTYRSAYGADGRISVPCGETPTASASDVVNGFGFQDTYAPENAARGTLLDMLQLPATATVSFSCDGFPSTVPAILRRIPTQYLTVGNTVTVDLEGIFEAAEWMPLEIQPEVGDEAIASVDMVGTRLRIHPLADGETEVLLNAVNEYGSTVNAFSISVGEFVDLFWYHSGPDYHAGVFHSRLIPVGSTCGRFSCGPVEGHNSVEPSHGTHCLLQERLSPEWGSVRFRYESSEGGETGERLFEICPHPTAYPKNRPGWYTYLVPRGGGMAGCFEGEEHAQRRFLFEGNGFRLVNGTVTEVPSLESPPLVGIRFYGPLGYANSMVSDGLSVSAQLGVDDFVVAEHVCRQTPWLGRGSDG